MKAIIEIDDEYAKYYDVEDLYAEIYAYGDVRPKETFVSLKPMPEKKCGRLIDADAYLKKVCTYKETGCGSCRFQIVCPTDEPTINDCLEEILGEEE